MSKTLPYAADADLPLKQAELDVLKRQFDSEGILVGVQTKFNYAWGLIKSQKRGEQLEGVKLLTDIYKDAPERRRECLYYLGLGHFKLGNYSDARRFNDMLLEKEPYNLQAASLRTLIEDKVAKDGYIGMGLLLAAGAVGSIIVGSFLRRSR